MSSPIPCYLSTSRLTTILWVIPFFGLMTFLFLIRPHLAGWIFSIWGILQGCFLLAIAWMQRKDKLRVTNENGFTRGDKTATKAVLLVHGFVDLPLAWQRQADVLAQKGYYVLVPHIDHDNPSVWMPMLEDLLSQLCKTYHHVELWGHSMGGALSLTLAPKFPLKRVVLWAPFLAPYLTRPLTTIIYFLHRLVLFGPRTFTFFPSHRRAKGEPKGCYYVNCTLPIQTFATMLQTQYLAVAAKQKAPLIFVLAYRERVVSNSAILKRFKNETILWAAHPSSEHQLTNTSDWLKNLNRVLKDSSTCKPDVRVKTIH